MILRTGLCLALVLLGCVKENSVSSESDDGAETGGTSSGSTDGENATRGNGGDDVNDADGAATAGNGDLSQTGNAEDDAQENEDERPGLGRNPRRDGRPGARPERDSGCQTYCDRVNECLVPECPGIELLFNDEACDEWCGETPGSQLAAFAGRECAEFNEILVGNSPELTSFCSDEEIPDVCEDICLDFNECGFEIQQEGCLRICRGYDAPMRDCAANANTCFELFDCVDDMEPEDQINYREVCQGKCFREFECVRNVCAAGTLEVDDVFGGGLFEDCRNDCLRSRPPIEELLTVFDGMCPEIVRTVRMNNPIVDERCDNDDQDTCGLLCEKVASCGAVTVDECRADCESWTVENRQCIDDTPRDRCDRINGCFGDSDGQQRCRTTCNHLQGCLLEACPPQIIAPDYADECTAGCLPEPPSPRLMEDYLGLSCRDVRGGVYRENPGLRPVCEGGQDFRPTAEECVDVCQGSLDACIPGGENQCVSLCRSLTRTQYTCALADGATCEAIDTCSNQSP